jgi:hypothetical protein
MFFGATFGATFDLLFFGATFVCLLTTFDGLWDTFGYVLGAPVDVSRPQVPNMSVTGHLVTLAGGNTIQKGSPNVPKELNIRNAGGDPLNASAPKAPT